MTAAETLHATCIAREGRGLLILGASGRGKSALALQLLALGALLVADDRVDLHPRGGSLYARCPAPLHGLIEARGIGLLGAPTLAEVEIVLAADLDRTESARLPPFRHIVIAGVTLPLVLQSHYDHFPAALWLYLSQGRRG